MIVVDIKLKSEQNGIVDVVRAIYRYWHALNLHINEAERLFERKMFLRKRQND